MNSLTIQRELNGFKMHLKNNHYSKHVVLVYMRKVKIFLKQKEGQIIKTDNHLILKKIINDYLNVLPITSQSSLTQAALHQYFYYVTKTLYITRVMIKDLYLNPSIEDEIERFNNYLNTFLSLSANTITDQIRTTRQFLYSSFHTNNFDPHNITFELVYVYLIKTLSHLSNTSKKTIISRVRRYIAFLDYSYEIKLESILRLPMNSPVYKHSNIPNYLTDIELESLFNTYDKENIYGVRNYAIIRCLSDLGLRCSEVADLSLENFDWNKSEIKIFNSKSKNYRTLPLPEITGKSIENYLINCRPKTVEKILFVRYKNIKGIPMGTSQVRNTVRNAAVKAKLTNFTGTHMLRRTVAKKMLDNGISLKVISDILGHKSIETTSIYTKVNFHDLRSVVETWPEVKL